MIFKPYGTTGKKCSVLGFGGMCFKHIDDQEDNTQHPPINKGLKEIAALGPAN